MLKLNAITYHIGYLILVVKLAFAPSLHCPCVTADMVGLNYRTVTVYMYMNSSCNQQPNSESACNQHNINYACIAIANRRAAYYFSYSLSVNTVANTVTNTVVNTVSSLPLHRLEHEEQQFRQEQKLAKSSFSFVRNSSLSCLSYSHVFPYVTIHSE